jgi:hypothetical protein
MPWNEIELVSDTWTKSAIDLDREMLLARRLRLELRMPEDGTCRHSRVGGHTFVTGVAGHHIVSRFADDG